MDERCFFNKDDIETAVIDALKKHEDKKRKEEQANIIFWKVFNILIIVGFAILSYRFISTLKIYHVDGIMMSRQDLKPIIAELQEKEKTLETAEERLKTAQLIESYSPHIEFYVLMIALGAVGIVFIAKHDSKEAANRVTFYVTLGNLLISLIEISGQFNL